MKVLNPEQLNLAIQAQMLRLAGHTGTADALVSIVKEQLKGKAG